VHGDTRNLMLGLSNNNSPTHTLLASQRLSLEQMPYPEHLQKSQMSHLKLNIFIYRSSC